MVSVGSKLNVSDNSGAIVVKCIKILGSTSRNSTNIGDTLVVSVQSAKKLKKVSEHDVHRCILIRQTSKTLRKNGVFINFLENSVVLIKKKNNDPMGNRVVGSVLQELRYKKCLKIMLLA
jgi:large subunit ribosomal protein L14